MSVLGKKLSYRKGVSSVVYFGATKNLKKRLRSYAGGYGHTQMIRNYILGHTICFRFQTEANYKQIEAQLITQFEITFGELPLLNSNKPKSYVNMNHELNYELRNDISKT